MAETTKESDFEADRPNRLYMDDPNINWRTKKPHYALADETFMKGRTKNHAPGSLERTLEDLVKTWEMEATHKPNHKDWETIDQESFTLTINKQVKFSAQDITKHGSYNLLLQNNPLYDFKAETFDSSHKLFKTAFKDGFPWEVLEVYSGPPRISFLWRHWAHWAGPYRDHPPTGEQLEMYGMAMAEVTDNLKIKSVNVYYDPNQILVKLEGKGASGSKKTGCPFT